MTVWKTQPVAEQPSIRLVRWRVIESERAERHFVGYSLEDGAGRVSSAINEFDPSTMRGITRTGRVYQLEGAPEFDQDASYTLTAWINMHQVDRLKEVTKEVADLSQCPQPASN